MSHLDEGQLTLLLDDELDGAERSSVESHLRECAECRRLLEETRGFMAEADRLIASVEAPPRPLPVSSAEPIPTTGPARGQPLPWRSMAWAATVVLAAGLGWYASDTRFHQPDTALTDLGRAAPAAEQPADASGGPAEPAGAASGKVAKSAPESPATTSAQPLPSQPAPLPRGNLAINPGRDRDEPEPARLAEQAPAATPPAAAPTAALSGSARAATADLERQSTAKSRESQPGFQEISLDQAVRALGGAVRLLDGFTPIRAEAGPPAAISNAIGGLQLVRIVYEDPPGRELWLSQQRLSTPTEMPRRDASAGQPVLEGDTLVSTDPDGRRTLRWRGQDGFLLALSGYLPGDSLKSLARRVQ